MIRLRPYKPSDAKSIVSWCKDEKTFLQWGGDHFGTFPISEDTMNNKYLHENGDCIEEDMSQGQIPVVVMNAGTQNRKL